MIKKENKTIVLNLLIQIMTGADKSHVIARQNFLSLQLILFISLDEIF